MTSYYDVEAVSFKDLKHQHPYILQSFEGLRIGTLIGTHNMKIGGENGVLGL